MFEIIFDVNNQKLTLTKPLEKLADETANYVRCKFNFKTDDWTGTTKTALFKSQSYSVTGHAAIDNDGYCAIPAAVLGKPGLIVVCLQGIDSSTGLVITTNTSECMLQDDSITTSPDTPVPTPSAYEAFVELVDEAVDRAVEAEEKIENFTVSSTTGEPGTSASVEKSETSTSFNLAFTIPRGATGATGATGPTGPTGAKGDKGDTGEKGDDGTITYFSSTEPAAAEEGDLWVDLDQHFGQQVVVTDDYDDLNNRPQINSVTLTGDKSFSDLGLSPIPDSVINALTLGGDE